MPKQVSIERIELFIKDVTFLKNKGISRSTIGDKMPGVGKANFSKYYNGKLPITEEFLAKFDEAWGKDLQPRTESKNIHDWPEKGSTEYSKEMEEEFRIMAIVEKLLGGQNQLINSNMILAESNKISAESNRILAENNQRLVDLLIQQGVKPDGLGRES